MTTTDTEHVADRLLRSTAARAYDPDVDVDWSAPLVIRQGIRAAAALLALRDEPV